MGKLISFTSFVPIKEEYLINKDKLLATLDVGMGGRAAEELFFGNGEITTGCGSDLNNTTYSAYRMVLLYAMGESLLSVGDLRQLSEPSRGAVEAEVQRLLKVILQGKLWPRDNPAYTK